MVAKTGQQNAAPPVISKTNTPVITSSVTTTMNDEKVSGNGNVGDSIQREHKQQFQHEKTTTNNTNINPTNTPQAIYDVSTVSDEVFIEAHSITIIHFNDCYNIEPGPQSSGAAGFLTAINQYRHLNPMILFSGDIISPSFISTFTKGEQMIPVLNDIGVDCAVFGNHEFDYGVDNLIEFVKQTSFPWLLSNVIDKETSNQLGDGQIYHIIEKGGVRFGLIGLIEEEWLSTLSTIDSSDVIYKDFVEEGQSLARMLKAKPHNVDFVIALTHFRKPNDIRLADNVPEIDLILGGHDHDYEIIRRDNCYIIKSGTDFREFSKITLRIDKEFVQFKNHVQSSECLAEHSDDSMINDNNDTRNDNVSTNININDDDYDDNDNSKRGGGSGKYENIRQPLNTLKPFSDIEIERISCIDYKPDEELKKKLDKFVKTIDDKMGKVLGHFSCDLDGRFASIRKYETNLGNFVTDIMLASTHADLAILNSGTLRSDRVHPKGKFTMRDLFNILGYIDPIAVLDASGYQIWKALENGVSQWPKLEGRFPQISGCSFAFDPAKSPLQRIDPKDICIGDEPIQLDKQYKLTTKGYLATGKDGYDVLKECKVLVPGDESPDLTTSILNHFEAIKIIKSNRRTHHRQSIICLSRNSIKKILHQSPNEQSTTITSNNNNDNNQANCEVMENTISEVTAPEDPTIGPQQPLLLNDPDNNNNPSHQNNRNDIESLDSFSPLTTVLNNKSSRDYSPMASSPLLDRNASRPKLAFSSTQPSGCHHSSLNVNLTPETPAISFISPPRSKRIMSLDEMELEQCKLAPQVEGRIRITGVNFEELQRTPTPDSQQHQQSPVQTPT